MFFLLYLWLSFLNKIYFLEINLSNSKSDKTNYILTSGKNEVRGKMGQFLLS